jgi:hypothetical protein
MSWIIFPPEMYVATLTPQLSLSSYKIPTATLNLFKIVELVA